MDALARRSLHLAAGGVYLKRRVIFYVMSVFNAPPSRIEAPPKTHYPTPAPASGNGQLKSLLEPPSNGAQAHHRRVMKAGEKTSGNRVSLDEQPASARSLVLASNLYQLIFVEGSPEVEIERPAWLMIDCPPQQVLVVRQFRRLGIIMQLWLVVGAVIARPTGH